MREHGVAVESQGEIFTNFYLYLVHGKLFKPVWEDTEISQIFVSLKRFWPFYERISEFLWDFIQFYKDSDQIYQDSDPSFKILALVSNLNWVIKERYSRVKIKHNENNSKTQKNIFPCVESSGIVIFMSHC